MNRGILTALAAIGTAQFLKIPLKKLKTGKWEWETFFETGGMPSSHSAGVSSLATYVALKRGIPTIDFALATVFGLIVMYDAQGIRHQTGVLSIRMNDLSEEVDRLAGQHPGYEYRKKEEKLKEMLGHQPQEVLGGALFGLGAGALSFISDKGRNKNKLEQLLNIL